MHSFRKIWRIYQGIIIPILMILVCAVVVFVGIIPGANAIQSMYIVNSDLKETNEAIRKRVTILEGFDTGQLRQDMLALLSAVPADKSLPTIISTIDAVSARTNTAIIDLRIDNPGSLATESAKLASVEEKKIGSSVIPFTIVVEGATEGMRAFLDTLIQVRRLLRISSIASSFTPSGDLRAQMVVESFYTPLPVTIGKSTDTLAPLTSTDLEVLGKVSTYPLVGQTTEIPVAVEVGTKTDPFSP